MIRTLIAEDELPLLRGIRQLIERIDSEFSVVCCAKNGKEALEYLTQHSVDVMFTDINMPILSGLDLMKQARELNSQLEIVVISGYNEFEYARQSMYYGAKSYLLKPIDRTELVGLLTTLKESLSSRSYTQKREALIGCLFGTDDVSVQKCCWEPLKLLYLCVGSFQSAQTAEDPADPGALSNNDMLLRVKKELKCTDAWLFFGQHPNEAIWILENTSALSLIPIANLVCSQLNLELPVTVAAEDVSDVTRLHETTSKLAHWLRSGLVFSKGRLIQAAPPTSGFQLSVADRSALQVAAHKRNYDEFSLVLNKLADQMRIHQVTQKELESLLTAILKLLTEEFAVDSARDAHATALELVSGNENYDSLFKDLLTYCGDLFQNRPFDTGNKSALMQAVDDYIVANITSPLSLKQLSAQFGLVAPYLSKLFKTYKGVSPAQYIQNIRIESAKRLLRENPSILSKDIAEALGYSNALYFSKTFYKNVGMYPSDYRAHCKQEKN
ncbi:response regulator [Pygmaiobacter massiliensis]|uniref:response regulator transcription factor n=1 Tax=Pygmaiobacter massiliensis TaxID=1917873 RepID=UPI000C7C78B1|nr:response regulator [Pygmaiobacter massiliensis]